MSAGDTPEQAFVAVRYEDRSWLVDLSIGEVIFVGPAPPAAVVLEGLAQNQGTFRWDGEHLSLERTAKSPPIYVNGKPLAARIMLRPGDELSVGDARMVVGMTTRPSAHGRRALTHHEFRERVAEEIARAARRGRPTALVMVSLRGRGEALLEACLSHFRAGDVVASYASDEVELLLPDTSSAQTELVLERLIGREGLGGASVGLAIAPEDADTVERLLRAARLALAASVETRGHPMMRPPSREDRPPAVAPAVRDAASLAVRERLLALADGDAPVLLSGEPSAGKGVFARMLHEGGKRAQRPLVIVKCASLLEPEKITALFGPRGQPEQGSLARDTVGGTLLLDEVCELPPDPQERLLDVLDHLDGDVRLVATTHLDLDVLAERGAFSEALRDAFDGEVVEVPSLRDRPDDIVPLAEAFATAAGAASPVPFSPGALARLRSHPWPGNVLELRNAVERAVRLAQGAEILAEYLPADSLPVGTGEGRLREHVDSVERDAIIKALAEHNNNQTHAAQRLGISRRALIYKMEKYGLKAPPGQKR